MIVDDASLRRELQELGRGLDVPAPSPDSVAEQVLARLVREGVATPMPTHRSRARAWLRARRKAWAALLAGILLVLVVTPPVRAAVAEWFDFGGVVVRHDPSATPGAGSPPPVQGRMSLDAAGRKAGFGPLVPEVLGAPQGVEMPSGERVVSMSWQRDGRTIRLDQFRATLDMGFLKSVGETARFAEVKGRQALWFAEPHRLELRDEEGRTLPDSVRSAGPTLVWQHDDVTLRLEGVASMDRAIEIAESAG